MIEVLQHPPLPNDVPHTLRSNDYKSRKPRTTMCARAGMLTLIFPNVFQRKGQASVLALDDSDFPKRSFPHYP